MTERRGTRLPEDPGYWERLAARSVEAAFATSPPQSSRQLSASAASTLRPLAAPWWCTLADAAWVLAAAAVVALIGGARLLGPTSPAAPVATHAFTGALAPEEPLLTAVLGTAEPPPASALLALIALRSDR